MDPVRQFQRMAQRLKRFPREIRHAVAEVEPLSARRHVQPNDLHELHRHAIAHGVQRGLLRLRRKRAFRRAEQEPGPEELFEPLGLRRARDRLEALGRCPFGGTYVHGNGIREPQHVQRMARRVDAYLQRDRRVRGIVEEDGQRGLATEVLGLQNDLVGELLDGDQALCRNAVVEHRQRKLDHGEIPGSDRNRLHLTRFHIEIRHCSRWRAEDASFLRRQAW